MNLISIYKKIHTSNDDTIRCDACVCVCAVFCVNILILLIKSHAPKLFQERGEEGKMMEKVEYHFMDYWKNFVRKMTLVGKEVIRRFNDVS
jgi:hypothetical protein